MTEPLPHPRSQQRGFFSRFLLTMTTVRVGKGVKREGRIKERMEIRERRRTRELRQRREKEKFDLDGLGA